MKAYKRIIFMFLCMVTSIFGSQQNDLQRKGSWKLQFATSVIERCRDGEPCDHAAAAKMMKDAIPLDADEPIKRKIEGQAEYLRSLQGDRATIEHKEFVEGFGKADKALAAAGMLPEFMGRTTALDYLADKVVGGIVEAHDQRTSPK